MNRLEGPPEQIDHMVRRFEEVVVPLLRGLDGFQGAMVLADRDRGTNIAISFWESEQALCASEAAVSQPREEAEAAAQATSPSIVETFEVLVKV
jgi:heme-degrading monooxygenase HmoA